MLQNYNVSVVGSPAVIRQKEDKEKLVPLSFIPWAELLMLAAETKQSQMKSTERRMKLTAFVK
jgi:apolipoprotein N-acyltransferase